MCSKKSAAPMNMPAGWYADPFTDHLQRYWTGDSWTKETRPLAPEPTPAEAPPVTTDGQPVVVRDYLVVSILTLIFCFWPLAIPAVYFAARANSAKSKGDLAVAVRYSERARLFIMLSLVGGALVALYLGFVVFTQGTDGLGLLGEVT